MRLDLGCKRFQALKRPAACTPGPSWEETTLSRDPLAELARSSRYMSWARRKERRTELDTKDPMAAVRSMALLIEGEQHGASDYFVALGEPLHNNVTGDSAYVVVPATMTFKVGGKQVTQSGAVFTVALRKLSDEWRIAAWAWAKGSPR